MKNRLFMNVFLMGVIHSVLCGTLLCMDAKKQTVQNFLGSNESREELVNGVLQLPCKLRRQIYNDCGSRVYRKNNKFSHRKHEFIYSRMVDNVIVDQQVNRLIVVLNDVQRKNIVIDSRYLPVDIDGFKGIGCTSLCHTREYEFASFPSVFFDSKKQMLAVGVRSLKGNRSFVEVVDMQKWEYSRQFSFVNSLMSDVYIAKESGDIVVSFANGEVVIIDAITGDRHQQFQYPDVVTAAYLNEKETHLIAITRCCVYIANVVTGQTMRTIEFDEAVQSVSVSNDETQLCIVTDHFVYMYDIKGQQVRVIHSGNQVVRQAKLNEDETQLLVAVDNGFFLYDVCTGYKMFHLDRKSCTTAVCFGQKDGEFVSVMANRIRIWEVMYKYSADQDRLLELLGIWSLLEKPSKTIITSSMLRSSMIDTLRLDEKSFTKIWKSFPLFVRRIIWGKMKKFIVEHGK